MTLTEEVKQAIIDEYNKQLPNENDAATRKKLGQFFTPPELIIKMIEKFDNLEGTILDPCGGSGNLLAACIIAGADPTKVYYNELDPNVFEIGKKRLRKLGVPEKNIICGNALEESAYDFR